MIKSTAECYSSGHLTKLCNARYLSVHSSWRAEPAGNSDLKLLTVRPTQAMGNTDAYANLSFTGVEQTGSIGSYTQVWSVNRVQATAAVSFIVGQLGKPGTISTADLGVTSDGHLEGISTLSINNGAVSTYWGTALDYTASLYYDTKTVATLFDEGNPVSQGAGPPRVFEEFATQ